MVARPAESLAAAFGSFITAIVAVLTAAGIDVPVAWVTAATALTGFVAAAVTWYVAARQRRGTDSLGSAEDGSVTG